jgi:1-deoxy-D-xylulose-5-phosphate synthase
LYSSERVQYWKDTIWTTLGKVGSKGDRVRRIISKAEGSFKSFITPGMLFEAIGFNYFGPINGNNVYKLIKILNNIKRLSGPIFLHIITEKGKGYDLAENDTYKLHSVVNTQISNSELSPEPANDIASTDIFQSEKIKKYQDIFGEAMLELFEKDNKLVAVSAAMLEGTGLTQLAEKYPNRVVDVGIAEGHAVTFAAGMATQGITPIVAIYSSFLQRAYDNIIHDCALQNLHIIFAIDRAGIVGEDGATHHGVFDLSYLRIIPNITIIAPKDGQELRDFLYSAVYDYKGCIAIRYPRSKTINISSNNLNKFNPILYGTSETLKDGNNTCIIAVGNMVDVAINTATILENDNISVGVVNARFIKPLDTKLLDTIAAKYPNIITIEDGIKAGGFGSAVCEYFVEKRYKNKIKVIAIDDHFVEHGNVNSLLEDEGLCVNNLVIAIETAGSFDAQP